MDLDETIGPYLVIVEATLNRQLYQDLSFSLPSMRSLSIVSPSSSRLKGLEVIFQTTEMRVVLISVGIQSRWNSFVSSHPCQGRERDKRQREIFIKLKIQLARNPEKGIFSLRFNGDCK